MRGLAALALLLPLAAASSTEWEARALAQVQASRSAVLEELRAFVRIPSVSALPEHADDVRRAGAWVVDKLTAMAVEHVEMLETGGHPVAVGDWLHAGSDAPTVLVYGHFDTQPAGGEWTTGEFAAELYEEPGEGLAVRGRGASDDKGCLLGALSGLAAVASTGPGFPVNLRFLLEGQEEIGSPQLGPFIRAHAARLRADVAFSADGDQHSPTVPSLTLGHRGAVALEVSVRTSSTDLHSGSWGGSVPNAAVVLSRLLAGMHTAEGAVAAPGFYQGVRELSAEERAAIAAVPLDEQADRAQAGVAGYVGEAGYSTLERRWVRPTAEVVGMWSGYTGEGIKTVLPAEAHAKIVCRLVGTQAPEQAYDSLAAWFKAAAPPYANVTTVRSSFSSTPSESPAASPANAAASAVLTELYGVPPLLKRAGGSIPAVGYFKNILGIDTTTLATGHSGNRVHAPNEYFAVRDLQRGAELWASVFFRLAAEWKRAAKDEL